MAMSVSNPSEFKFPALISIHDVMPETFGRVAEILRRLSEDSHQPVTLLVVPHKDWTPEQLRQLCIWSRAGCELAGHGWTHQAAPRKNFYHRLHSLVLSRNAAEHLSKSPDEITEMIRRCWNWFAENDLPQPELYVPPAWAMGRLRRKDLDSLPFEMYETLFGVYHRATRRLHRMPLAGYEADNLFRKLALQLLNPLNQSLAALLARPLRVSIHPYDPQLLLGKSMWSTLERCARPCGYPDAIRHCLLQPAGETN